MSSDAELNAKLTELLRVMVSRLPPNKKLPTAVVQQLLRSKYGETYSEAYVSSHETFISDTILKLSIEKEKAAMAATKQAAEDSDDDDSSDDDDEDDDDSTEDEDEEESAGSEDEEEEDDDDDDDLDSDDEDDEDSDDDEEDDDDGDGEPNSKKSRHEDLEAIAKKELEATTATTATLAERCKGMAECLRKLHYRVRAPAEEESLEAYLQNFLIAEFVAHGMDPERYSKTDIKRYRIKREVELLQQDGASLALDRRSRAGRGFSNVTLASEGGSGGAGEQPTPAASNKQTSMFLDDE